MVLIGLPARYVFGPLGGAGTPAQILAMLAALWWAARHLNQTQALKRARQPVRRAMLVFSAAVLLSYIAATTRAIDTVELNATDRGLLGLLGWIGVVLVAGDLIPTRARMDTLLRRLVMAGGALATLGMLQFWTGQSFTNYLKLPGLSENTTLVSVSGRDGFNRPAGTALHPIEFGVVLAVLLPLALHYAFVDRDRPLIRRWYPVAAMALAVPASVSRSSILCTAVVLAFLIPSWQRQVRRVAYLALAGLGGLVFVAMPGMLGTLLGLFSGISSDSSALSRTGSYGIAWEFISRAPVFGRGFATFLPVYRILDNQYLGTLIELGFFGLASLLGLYLTGIFTALRVRRRSVDPDTRSLAQALAAAMAAGATAFAVFDAFSFGMISGLMFFVLGAIGGLHRLQALGRGDPSVRRHAAVPPQRDGRQTAALPDNRPAASAVVEGLVARHAGEAGGAGRWRKRHPDTQRLQAGDGASLEGHPTPEGELAADTSPARPGASTLPEGPPLSFAPWAAPSGVAAGTNTEGAVTNGNGKAPAANGYANANGANGSGANGSGANGSGANGSGANANGVAANGPTVGGAAATADPPEAAARPAAAPEPAEPTDPVPPAPGMRLDDTGAWVMAFIVPEAERGDDQPVRHLLDHRGEPRNSGGLAGRIRGRLNRKR